MRRPYVAFRIIAHPGSRHTAVAPRLRAAGLPVITMRQGTRFSRVEADLSPRGFGWTPEERAFVEACLPSTRTIGERVLAAARWGPDTLTVESLTPLEARNTAFAIVEAVGGPWPSSDLATPAHEKEADRA